MSYVIIMPEQMQTSRWSGGSTTQMMIFPAGSSYRNRDFRFRISSAVVEDAVSVFTKLDGVERFLTVLEGKISLRTGASEPQELNAYDTIHFYGGDDTVSEGQCVDFNLMLRGCKGVQKAYFCQGKDLFYAAKQAHSMLYCRDTDMTLKLGGEEIRLPVGSLFVREPSEQEEVIELLPGKPAYVVIAEAFC